MAHTIALNTIPRDVIAINITGGNDRATLSIESLFRAVEELQTAVDALETTVRQQNLFIDNATERIAQLEGAQNGT